MENKDLKICIVTQYTGSQNYGGVLQAYALCKYLNDSGYTARQLLRKSNSISHKRTLSLKGLIKETARVILGMKRQGAKLDKRREGRKKLFADFRENAVSHTAPCYDQNLKDLNSEYDCFIAGSNQIWNPFALNPVYFLGFANNDRYKFSYAASVCQDTLSEQEKKQFEILLQNLDAISVREPQTVSILQELTPTKVESAIDPTLLIAREKYEEVIAPRIVKDKYVFCYFLGKTKEGRRLASVYAKKHGLKVVNLPHVTNYIPADEHFGDVKLYDVGPSEFLSLIKNAEYVFTDSFHGTVFSHIFNKEYVIFGRMGHADMGVRIVSLTEMLGSTERYINSFEKATIEYIESLKKIDYDSDFAKLNQERSKSIEYLQENLEKAKLLQEGKYKKVSNKPIFDINTIVNRGKCSGCFACYSICPFNAIKKEENEEGFMVPFIDAEKCTHCGICIKVCPINYTPTIAKEKQSYACKNKDKGVRMSSSSGGVFTLLAEKILEEGGAVFGASYSEDYKEVKHIKITEKNDLYKLRTSKYTQSDTGNTFKQARELLEQGKKVLYTGTACQISGLKNYLKKDYDNLYTHDLICHGVPSPKTWKDFLSIIEKKEKSQVTYVNVREKNGYGRIFDTRINLKNGKSLYILDKDDKFKILFLADIFLRPSCYACSFRGENRASDITIADFWGVEDVLPDFQDGKGVSLVIVNTDKGADLFNKITDKTDIKEVNTDTTLKNHYCYYHSKKMPENRAEFIDCYNKNGFDKAFKKYLSPTFVSRVKNKIKNLLR